MIDYSNKLNIKILDTKTKRSELLLQKTSNSYLVTQGKTSKKGVDCDNWYAEREFNERFKFEEDGL